MTTDAKPFILTSANAEGESTYAIMLSAISRLLRIAVSPFKYVI